MIKRTSRIDLKLFVGQIPKSWHEKEVSDYFSKYGEILESQIIRDPKSGNHKGCAFVKFASMTCAENAQLSLQNQSQEAGESRVKRSNINEGRARLLEVRATD